jgi:hypothetical protein
VGSAQRLLEKEKKKKRTPVNIGLVKTTKKTGVSKWSLTQKT